MYKLLSWKTFCFAGFSAATAMIFAHAQSTTPLCFTSGTLPEGELGRLWPVMKKATSISSRQGRLTNLSWAATNYHLPEYQISAEADLQSCAANLANFTGLEENLLRFVVTERLIKSLDAVRHDLTVVDRLVDNSTFCASQIDNFNHTACWRETAYCLDWRREAHAQKWKAKTIGGILIGVTKRLESFRSSTTEDSTLFDASGSGSGWSFSGLTSAAAAENFATTSSFVNKLNAINALLKKADRLVSNVTVTSFLTDLNLSHSSVTCRLGGRQTKSASQEELLRHRKMAALFRISQALEKVRGACKLHHVATSLKEVIQRVQNIENWGCNQTGFVHCASEKPGMSNAESGLQARVCSVMLAQSSASPICQGTDMSCCGHLEPLKKLQQLANFSSYDMVASGLIQELHSSCRSVTHSSEANTTRKATCYNLQHQRTGLSTCSNQKVRLRFSCPFPFVSTSLQKYWDEEASSQFKIILQNVLQSVYQLNETPVLDENQSASIFPCAKTCDPRAQGIPPLIYQSLRFIDITIHHIWLCVFLRAIYVLYINWYKMKGSQPHRSLLLCNFSFALATFTRLITSYYTGLNSPNCRLDGSVLAGKFAAFDPRKTPLSIYFCPFTGMIYLMAVLMLSIGLSWAILIWKLIVEDMVNCQRSEARAHIGKPFFQRMKEDKRFRMEVFFILLCVLLSVGISNIMISTSKTFVSHPLLDLCILDNWPIAYISILFGICFPAGGALIWIHKRIEKAFNRSDWEAGLGRLSTNQSTERIRWYGRRLRVYGASTLLFSSFSLIFVTSGFIQPFTKNDQSEKLGKLLLCSVVGSPGQVCPEYTWPGLISQYGHYWFVQFLCVYNIVLLSWCWQKNLKQPANLVLAMLKDKGSRMQSSW